MNKKTNIFFLIIVFCVCLNANANFLLKLSKITHYKISGSITPYGSVLIFLRMLKSPQDTDGLFFNMKRIFPLNYKFWEEAKAFIIENKTYFVRLDYNIKQLEELMEFYIEFLKIYSEN